MGGTAGGLTNSSSCDEYISRWRCLMNPVERALYQELTQLLDRLAASMPEGSVDMIRAANPTLKARLDDADPNLPQPPESVLQAYRPCPPPPPAPHNLR